MGKVLKVFTVIVLILGVFVLFLGIKNFNKRELLIGRTHSLEKKIQDIASTIEKRNATPEVGVDYVGMDIDEVTNRQIAAPQLSDFWDSYNSSLEKSDSDMFSLTTEDNKNKLRNYARVDAEGKPMKDSYGQYIITGPGTMESLLQEVLDRAIAQYKNLGDTRNELIKVRKELVTTIKEVNSQKSARRRNLSQITEFELEVANLKNDVDKERKATQRAERERDELNDSVRSLKDEVAKLQEQDVEHRTENAALKAQIKKLTETQTPSGGVLEKTSSQIALSAGVKGSVVFINKELGFVIIKLNDAAAAELVGGDLENPRPFVPVEMMVTRKGADGNPVIVTRVRVTNITNNAKQLAVAENLFGWEQMPLAIGDEATY